MKGNWKSGKRMKCVVAVIFLIMIWLTGHTYATEEGNITPETDNEQINTGGAGQTAEEQLPYIEMKVKTNKGQVFVECWASNFNTLEGANIAFTYDSSKLTPSNIIDNTEISKEDLKSIEYVPADEYDNDFRVNSINILKNCFEFEDEYKEALQINHFKFLAKDKDVEALLFVFVSKTKTPDATTPTLLGKFSFKLEDGQKIEKSVFGAKEIFVSCNGEPTSVGADGSNPEKVAKMLEFKYEQYGTITGTIKTGYYKKDGTFKSVGKNIATIKIFEKNTVKDMNWEYTKDYKKNRLKLGDAKVVYTTKITDNGDFTINELPFGEYVILVDKDYYLDFVITNLNINSSDIINLNEIIQKQTENGKDAIILEIGDVDKSGEISPTDQSNYNKYWKTSNKNPESAEFFADLDDNEKVTPSDMSIFNSAFKYGRKKTLTKIQVEEK